MIRGSDFTGKSLQVAFRWVEALTGNHRHSMGATCLFEHGGMRSSMLGIVSGAMLVWLHLFPVGGHPEKVILYIIFYKNGTPSEQPRGKWTGGVRHYHHIFLVQSLSYLNSWALNPIVGIIAICSDTWVLYSEIINGYGSKLLIPQMDILMPKMNNVAGSLAPPWLNPSMLNFSGLRCQFCFFSLLTNTGKTVMTLADRLGRPNFHRIQKKGKEAVGASQGSAV